MVDISTAVIKYNSNFSVSSADGRWRYGGKEFNIGRSRYIEDGRKYGVIGVYDRTNIKHLNLMVHDANEAVRPRGNIFDD